MPRASSPKSRSALGMGLDALLPDRLEGEYFLCPVEEIRPSAHQPRQRFDDDSIEELAQSIREKGLIQPLILRRVASGGYELIAGERRWRAAQRAGLTEVPSILRDAEEEEVLEMALVENLQREDLNAVDQAEAYRILSQRMGLTQEEIAQRIGKSRVAVANTLRLLALPGSALEALRRGEITPGHARAILSVDGEEARLALFHEIRAKGLSVRQAEGLARRSAQDRPRRGSAAKDPNVRALEERLSRRLGTRVALQPGRRKEQGRISIEYRTLDDLDRLLALLEGAGPRRA
ncbi:MAG: ParB/RepB/Spo0J family partition protein [Deferrisomatales bacterium]